MAAAASGVLPYRKRTTTTLLLMDKDRYKGTSHCVVSCDAFAERGSGSIVCHAEFIECITLSLISADISWQLTLCNWRFFVVAAAAELIERSTLSK